MRKTKLGCTILEGHDIADLPLVSENAEILENELEKKVDKVTGKGLSDENYTLAEKNKLAGIEKGANKTVLSDSVSSTSTTTAASSKAVKTAYDKGNHSHPYAPSSHTHTSEDLPNATTTAKGVVQLSNSTTSTSTTLAATPSAVKAAMDKANEAFQSASDGKQKIATAITGKGVPTSSSDTFSTMANNINAIETDPTGDATAVASDILSGKTAYSKGSKLTGTMINRGAINNTITTQGGQIIVPEGYHNGSGIVKAQFANLAPENIRNGVNIGGVVGKAQTAIKWTPQYSTAPSGPAQIIYAPDKDIYLIATDSFDKIYKSTNDCRTWSEVYKGDVSSSSVARLWYVPWLGEFFALTYRGLRSSKDGETWDSVSNNNGPTGVEGLVFSDSRVFVWSSWNLVTTTNLEDWISVVSLEDPSKNAVAVNNDTVIALSKNKDKCYRSTDGGVSFKAYSPPTMYSSYAPVIRCANGIWIYSSGSHYSGDIRISTDNGNSWNNRALPTSASTGDFYYDDNIGMFFAHNNFANTAISADGETWVGLAPLFHRISAYTIYSPAFVACYGKDKFVAVQNNGDISFGV